ncbi:MAG TPA: hypothetical protein VIW24_23290 [Aldersonia sp.]
MPTTRTVVASATAAGVSAVVAAVIASIGTVAIIDNVRDDSPAPVTTVMALPAASSGAAVPEPEPALAPVPAPVPAPVVRAPAAAAAVVRAPAAAAPVVRAPAATAPTVTRAPAASAPAPAPAARVAAHPTPSNTELVDKLKVLLSTATPDKKAAELQGTFAALPTIDGVVARTLLVDPLIDWTIVSPIQVDGDVLTARLQRTVPLVAPLNDPITWRWVDGTWKLSNQSVCFLATQTFLPCTA